MENMDLEIAKKVMGSREINFYWHVGNWCNVTAKFKGIHLNEINMSSIIGVK